MLVVIIKSLPNVLAVPHAGQAAYRTSSRQGPVHGESHMLVLLCDPDHLRDRYGGSHSIGSVPLGTSSIAHIVDAMVVHKVMLASTVRISSSILDSPRKLIVTQMIVERYRNIVCHDMFIRVLRNIISWWSVVLCAGRQFSRTMYRYPDRI